MMKLIALTTLVLVVGAPAAGRADDAAEENRGQPVSDCHHRANLQNLKGEDRTDFVEWCTSRDGTAASDRQPPDRYSECYTRIGDHKLGETRNVRNCAGRLSYLMHRS